MVTSYPSAPHSPFTLTSICTLQRALTSLSLSLPTSQEWEAPQPSKRPDIFPEFDKPERVFLPKPLPGDPEMPDEEEEEAKKRTVRDTCFSMGL